MQLPQYFPDLRDERCMSAIAIVHSRFSTNTFPSWPLAHPFRFVAHNGEINTVRGNRNRMHAREAMLASSLIPGDLARLSPICTPDASDSASFDQVLELLHLGGRSLPHAVLMMVPEAWENNTSLAQSRRDFWQFHASLMEPWDGPACVTFTDGTVVGAVLDRNGLRPDGGGAPSTTASSSPARAACLRRPQPRSSPKAGGLRLWPTSSRTRRFCRARCCRRRRPGGPQARGGPRRSCGGAWPDPRAR